MAPVTNEPAPTPKGRVPLEKFAAPGGAKTVAAQGAPAEKPIISPTQIAQFYSDVRAGRYVGRDSEKDRAEKMIFDAQREGRVRIPAR